MENPTPFDLNRALQAWRENLAALPTFRAENLDELESHLRDSVATLQTRGLTADEAFLIATRRVGTGGQLAAEFGKVNQPAVWLDRFLWILIAFQVWKIISSASVFLTAGASVLATTVNEFLPGLGLGQILYSYVPIIISLLTSPLITAVLLAMVWRSYARPREQLRAIFRRLLLQPWALALALFSCSVIFAAGASWALFHWVYPSLYHQHPGLPYYSFRMLAVRLPEFIIMALLTLFVARKRLHTSKA